MNVVAPIDKYIIDYCMIGAFIKGIEVSAKKTAIDNMKKQLEKFPLAKEVKVSIDVRFGLSYDEILKEAERVGIDLIVIASLGQSGLAKYIIGSVARNVLRSAKCPVLLTK
mgnify:FL=1